MAIAQSQVAVKHNLIALHFSKQNVADANGTMTAIGTDAVDYKMPWAGSVVGFSVSQNGTLNTGTLTFRPTFDDVAAAVMSSATLLIDHSTKSASATQEARKAGYQFTAGQRVGVTYNKSGTVEPTSTDIAGLLFVLLENVEM